MPAVTIAIPISQERISPLLDAAGQLLLVTCQRGREIARKKFILGPMSPKELAQSVAELRVDVLLCAALSQGLQRELERMGVRVQPHLCGDAEAVLQAFTVTGFTGRNSACRAAGGSIRARIVAVVATRHVSVKPFSSKPN